MGLANKNQIKLLRMTTTTPANTTATMDLGFDEYTARQYRELEPDKLLERAMLVRPSGNYRYNDKGWTSNPYPGFAVLSMVDENPGNESLPGILAAVQKGLSELCPWKAGIYLLPADSFHQTVANCLSEARFEKNVLEPGLEGGYPGLVGKAFEKMEAAAAEAGGMGGGRGPVLMKLIGVSIFGTALGILGVFEEEEHYRRILHFRSGFYSDPGLAALDIRMTRPFIGHITIAYLETELTGGQRRQLAEAVHVLNGRLKEIAPVFRMSFAGLRRYETLSIFQREESYPGYSF
jgi:hypothetical protein